MVGVVRLLILSFLLGARYGKEKTVITRAIFLHYLKVRISSTKLLLGLLLVLDTPIK